MPWAQVFIHFLGFAYPTQINYGHDTKQYSSTQQYHTKYGNLMELKTHLTTIHNVMKKWYQYLMRASSGHIIYIVSQILEMLQLQPQFNKFKGLDFIEDKS